MDNNSEAKKYDFYDKNNLFIEYDSEKGFYVTKGFKCDVIDYKDESFLDNYGRDGEFVFLIVPPIDEKSEDWPAFLNYFSDKGYKIKLVFYETYDEYNCGIVDTFEYFSKEKDLITNKNKIAIGIQGKDNYNEMNFNEFISIDDVINLCVQDIKSHNFSPLENIIAAYKCAIQLFYTGSLSEGEPSFNMYFSIKNYEKDISPLCQTFAQTFLIICQRLNIDCEYRSIHLEKPHYACHAINYMHVVDDKYGIDGNYLFDPTMGNVFVQVLGSEGNDINDILIGFGLGKNNKLLSEYYYPEIVEDNSGFFRKNIGDEDIPKDVKKAALEVVNSSFIEDSKGNSY